MDEILCANFMVFHDGPEEPYDLWVADEGWEIDYYLHENPNLKRTALRLAHRLRRLAADPDADDNEGFLAADYNAEMIEQIARFPAARPRAVRRQPRRRRARRASAPTCR